MKSASDAVFASFITVLSLVLTASGLWSLLVKSQHLSTGVSWFIIICGCVLDVLTVPVAFKEWSHYLHYRQRERGTK